MMLWGSTERHKQISEGQFFCKKCKSIRRYSQKRVAKYFTLFSIPLIKTKDLGEFVECEYCKNGDGADILDPGSQEMLKMEAISKYSLQRGAPVDDVMTQLIEAGAKPEIAEVIIKKVLA
jgi:zinc-ribbon family